MNRSTLKRRKLLQLLGIGAGGSAAALVSPLLGAHASGSSGPTYSGVLGRSSDLCFLRDAGAGFGRSIDHGDRDVGSTSRRCHALSSHCDQEKSDRLG